MQFKALVSNADSKGTVSSSVELVEGSALPDGDVLVAVEWAGLNYKDAMCLSGLGNLVRTYPHVAGIDFAGRVVESSSAKYHPGQAVVLTGWRVGEVHWGGYAQRARVDAGMAGGPAQEAFHPQRHGFGHGRSHRHAGHQQAQGRRASPPTRQRDPRHRSGAVASARSPSCCWRGSATRSPPSAGGPELAEQLIRIGATRSGAAVRDHARRQRSSVLDKERWAGAIDPGRRRHCWPKCSRKSRYGGVVAVGRHAAGGADVPDQCHPLYPPRCVAGRHRQRHATLRSPRRRLGPALDAVRAGSAMTNRSYGRRGCPTCRQLSKHDSPGQHCRPGDHQPARSGGELRGTFSGCAKCISTIMRWTRSACLGLSDLSEGLSRNRASHSLPQGERGCWGSISRTLSPLAGEKAIYLGLAEAALAKATALEIGKQRGHAGRHKTTLSPIILRPTSPSTSIAAALSLPLPPWSTLPSACRQCEPLVLDRKPQSARRTARAIERRWIASAGRSRQPSLPYRMLGSRSSRIFHGDDLAAEFRTDLLDPGNRAGRSSLIAASARVLVQRAASACLRQ